MIDFSKGFRNAVYDFRTSQVIFWGWDEHGNRTEHRESYKPYLFTETTGNHYDATSIFGTRLRKVEFKSSKDRQAFIDKHPTGRVFHSLSVEQQYIIDACRTFSTQQLTQQPLRIFYIDIEVHSPNEFPHAAQASHPVNVITIYDSLEHKFHTWGTGTFNRERLDDVFKQQGIQTIKREDVQYYFCKDEIELFHKFTQFWTENFPDVVTGWNIEQFDIPYLVNRITNLFGSEQHLVLSPVRRVMTKQTINTFNAPSVKTQIAGMSLIDYMELYKTFSRSQSDSYKLGDVASKELKITKIKHGAADLVTLADEDWDLFVCYNIQDVNLLILLEQQLNFLGIARFVSVNGFTKVENALGKVSIVQGAIAGQALLLGKILPTFRNSQTIRGEYDGGYVREPRKGMHGNIVSYDANSLYPNAIITLNISPECKVGKIISGPDHVPAGVSPSANYILSSPAGKSVTLTPEQFEDLIVRGQCTITSAGILYSQKKRGIVPSFIDGLYKQRVEMQKQLADIEQKQQGLKSGDPKLIALKQKAKQLDNIQYSTKILLNSIYGNFANVNSCLFDLDAAASITLSGQSVVKQAAEIANEWARRKFNDPTADIVTYGDTDSVAKDTTIRSSIGTTSVEFLYDYFSGEQQIQTVFGHEIINVQAKSLHVASFDVKTNNPIMAPVKNLIRHKVKKKMYRVKLKSGRYVDMSEDHSAMVMRKGEHIEVKPQEIDVRNDRIVQLSP